MKRDYWYRKKAWTAKDREEFFTHLNRSRKAIYKAQYLRIQAWHLQEVGTPEMFQSAIQLLDLLVKNYPEPSELASAHLQKAQCMERFGHIEATIQEYQASFDAQRSFKGVRTDAALAFGMVAVSHNLTRLYENVLAALDEFSDSRIFPTQVFKYCTIKGLISAYRGRATEASYYARLAINEASKTDSGLRYHPKVGLVEGIDPELKRKLIALARMN